MVKHLAKSITGSSVWAENMILLDDFNVIDPKDKTFKALTEPGFQVHKNLLGIGSNAGQSKHFDQIAFIAPSLKDKLDDCNAGVFNYYKYVYCDGNDAIYASDIPKTKKGNPGKFSEWRTYQISDHLPVWIELRVDFSPEYLSRISPAAGNLGGQLAIR